MNLYRLDAAGSMRKWTITNELNVIVINHGIINGAMTEIREVVKVNKSGRTLQEQVESRVNSRINKQLDKGYFRTLEEAGMNDGMNKLSLYKPMLAQQANKQKNVNMEGAVYQRKLDGNRMLATKSKGEVITYTRNGKLVETLGHINEQLDWLEEGQTVDGEIYIHGMALKDIGSRMRKVQPGTLDLNYHIYDVVDDRPFTQRFMDIMSNSSRHNSTKPNIYIEPFWQGGLVNEKELFSNARKEGYEGLMLRIDGYGYEVNKRSKGLLKIKYRYDAEATVIDVEKAKDSTGILVLKMPDGNVFKAVAPGDRNEKLHVGMMPELYVGKELTYSYAYITDYGIPFHAVAEQWRG